jgi:hypothetical protein
MRQRTRREELQRRSSAPSSNLNGEAVCRTHRTRRIGFTALACLSMSDLASAAATMETIGAEKCGGRVTRFEVEFLAPDRAALEATAKALVRGAPSLARDAVTLSIDGKPCTNGRCLFQARKGDSYKLAAATETANL